MIKLIGAVLILLSTSGMGFLAAATMEKRVRELEWFQRLIKAIEAELCYSMAPVESLLTAVSLRKELKVPEVLATYRNLAVEGECFPICWKQAVEQTQLNLESDDRQMIASLSQVLGAYDSTNQLAALESLDARIKIRIVEERNYRDKHSKLYYTLGILSGVALCILLL